MVSTAPEQFPEEIPSQPAFPHGNQPLHQYLAEHADRRPESTMLNYYGRELTYDELNTAVDQFATHLADLGYKKGDTLLLLLQNCPQYYIGYHAAHRLGMRVSPCSPMAKQRRIRYQVDDAEVSVALAHDTFSETLDAVREDTALEDAIYVRYESYLPSDPVPNIHEDMTAAIETDCIESAVYLDDVLAETPPDPPTVDHELDDVVLLQYTSGTTGMPKGCCHTYLTILFKAASTAAVSDFDRDGRQLAVMPVFHVAGKLNAVDAPLIHGGSVILLTRYEPKALLEAIDAHRPTSGWVTTPMARSLLDHPNRDEYDLTSFELVPATSFGQTLTDELCEQWEEVTGANMFESAYGLSETHTMDTFTRGLGRVEEGFVGLPSHEVDIVIRDWETHEEVPRGEKGEISVKSPSVMVGYNGKLEQTAEAMHDEYVLTGDVGKMTDDGQLYFLGRRKHLIKTSGYSVSPAEVEIILKDHSDIDNAAVVGRPHETKGEEVIAMIASSDNLSAEEVTAWAADELAPYKQPAEVHVQDSLPTTDVGKLDRQAVESEVRE